MTLHNRVPKRERGSIIRAYVVGYLLALALTLSAFIMIKMYVDTGASFLSRTSLIVALVVLGLEQLAVQVVCFLHLDREPKPRWRLVAFVFAALFVFAVVAGSLWIMANLNYNMMPAHDMDAYMLDQ